MDDIRKLLDEQKQICQTEFDKRSVQIDGVWYVACEDILNAPYPIKFNVPKNLKIWTSGKS